MVDEIDDLLAVVETSEFDDALAELLGEGSESGQGKPDHALQPEVELIELPKGRPVSLVECIQYLAGRCDGAHTLDGHGFNRNDSEIGHSLADRPYEKWSDRQRAWAFKKVRFYRRQLTEAALDWESVPAPEPAPPKPEWHPVKEIVLIPNGFGIRFHHLSKADYDHVRHAVNAIPGVKWIYDKEQLIPASVGFDSVSAKFLREFAKVQGFEVDPAVTERFFHLIDKGQIMRDLAVSVDAPDYDLGDAEREWGDPLDPRRPWGHQRSFVQYAEMAEFKVLLADEPGTGKTISAILGWIRAREVLGIKGRLLIACPKSVMRQWRSVLREVAPEFNVALLSGQGVPPLIGVDVLIANYDILRLNSNEELNDLMTALAFAGNIEGVICDESHRLKNAQASRTRAMSELMEHAKPRVRFFLTGSPIPNRVREFVAQLDMLGLMESHFGSTTNFIREYERTRDYKGLNDRLVEAGYMCRTTDHHAISPDGKYLELKDVPPYVLSPELVQREAACENEKERKEMTKAIRNYLTPHGYAFLEGALRLNGRFPKPAPIDLDTWDAYKYEHDQTRVWMQQMASEMMDDPEAFQRWLRAYALIRINKLRLSIARKRMKEAKPYIEDLLLDGEKVVVAVWHREIAEELLKHFKGAAVIQGGQSSTVRDDEKFRFINDPECRLMICQVESGGEGVDGLQHVSHNVVWLEYPWNPGKLDQMERRLYRGGQKHGVIQHYVVANPEVMDTIDQYMLDIIDRKKADTTAAQHGAEAPQESMLRAVVDRFLGRSEAA